MSSALYARQVFPGGRHKNLIISPTAGNVATVLTPGVGLRWKILRGRVYLTCDATVATRAIALQISDGVNVIEALAYTQAATATQVLRFDFGEGIIAQSGGLGDNGGSVHNYLGIQNLILTDMSQLLIVIQSGVAGDSYEGGVSMLEMAVS